MNFDDLKRQWEACDARLTGSIRLNTRLLRESCLGRSRKSLRWLSVGIVAELMPAVPLLIVIGSYVADRISAPRFLIPGLALHLSVILLAGFGIHQLVALGGIDYAGPVLAIQRRLETLRRQRIRATQWTFIMDPLLWTPLLIVALDGLLRVDAYAGLGVGYLAANLAVGLAAIPVLLWAAKRFAGRFGSLPWMQRLMDDVAGKSLTEATAFLEQIDGLGGERTVA